MVPKWVSCCAVAAVCVSGRLAAQSVISTVAGTEWFFDGDGQKATGVALGRVTGLALDGQGALVFTDESSAVTIRLNAGNIRVIAGNGFQAYSGNGGPAVAAALNSPNGVAFDATGAMYVCDTGNNRIRKVAADGTISVIAGTGRRGSGGDNGLATDATFDSPLAIAVDASQNIYVADASGRIRKFSPGGIITTAAGGGQASGDGIAATTAAIGEVGALAVDSSGSLYFADVTSHRVRKVSPQGIITTIAGNGRAGFGGDTGQATAASLYGPRGIAVDASGTIYISDTNNYRIRKVSNGVITSIAGGADKGFSGDGGPAASARFRSPTVLLADNSGNLFVADRDNYRIRKIDSAGNISTVAGTGVFPLLRDASPAVNGLLFRPFGIARDNAGNLLIADTSNNRIRKLSITSGGNFTLSSIAGDGTSGFSGDGKAATDAWFMSPAAVAVDRQDNIYVADQDNHRIRKISPAGTVTTFAGSGCSAGCAGSYGGDGGPAAQAQLNVPTGVAADASGSVYIVDAGNNRIRKVLPNGTINAIAGSSTVGFQDGPAGQARLNVPFGIAADPNGNLFFTDTNNGRVRKIAPDGNVSTVAGGGQRKPAPGQTMPATDAALGIPTGIAIDSAGNIYFADALNNSIGRISPSGQLTIAAGSGTAGFAGDGGPADQALLRQPFGVAIVNLPGFDDAVVIADTRNNRVRAVMTTTGTIAVNPTSLTFSAKSGGRVSDSKTVLLSSALAGLQYTSSVTTSGGGNWLKVSAPSPAMPSPLYVAADPTGLPAGTYRGTVTVGAPAARPPAQSIDVVFQVDQSESPKLALNATGLTFPLTEKAQASTQVFNVLNQGSGSLAFAVESSSNEGAWLSVSAASGTATPGQPAAISVTADPGDLAPGTYLGRIGVRSGAQSSEILVTMTLAPSLPIILVSQPGLSFTTVEGGGAPLPQAFSILNVGRGSMNWSASPSTLSGGADWLTIDGTQGTVADTGTAAGQVEVRVNAINLKAGSYQGRVTVSSPDASNAQQTVGVFLTVLPPDADPGPEVSPAGVFFSGSSSDSPGSQILNIANLGAKAVDFVVETTSDGGVKWLSAGPEKGTLRPGQFGRISLQPDFTVLSGGVRRATVKLNFGSVQRFIDILAVVSSSSGAKSIDTRFACTPNSITAQFLSPSPGFSVEPGRPVTIELRVVTDPCPNLSGPGFTVDVVVSTGEIIRLKQKPNAQGVWTETWTPKAAAPSIDLYPWPGYSVGSTRVEMPEPERNKVRVTGQVKAAVRTPLVNPNGIVNAASVKKDVPVAPGSLVSIYGNLLSDSTAQSPTAPYGTDLGGTKVYLGPYELPLSYVSPNQINAQLPFNLPSDVSHQLIVRHGTDESVPVPFPIASVQPAIFTTSGGGSGQGAITYADGRPADSTAPAQAGDIVVVYCTGLGAVSPFVQEGQPAPNAPLSQTKNAVSVTIGGVRASTIFTGLSPGTAGLYQVNAIVPRGVTPGNDVPVIITVTPASGPALVSPPVTMAVK